MGAPVTILQCCHDSIGLGEDGPTHQSIEHAASLRLIPNFDVWRPGDSAETAVAWTCALARQDGPALLLSRQNVAFQARPQFRTALISRGGYILADVPDGNPALILIATGSELDLAVQARAALTAEGLGVRVVSMPSTSVFDRQDQDYRDSVLPSGVPRVAIEAGVTDFWRKYVGLDGAVIGIDTFGESAPAGVLYQHFGITVANIIAAARRLL